MIVKGRTVVLGIGAYFAGVGTVLHNSVEGGLPGLWNKFTGLGSDSDEVASRKHESKSLSGQNYALERARSHGEHNNQDNHSDLDREHNNCGHSHSHKGELSDGVDLSDWRLQAAESRLWSSVTDEERQKAFERGAQSYDDEIGTDELVMGLNLMRRALIRHSQGQVLEVAAGTGRNFGYYDLNKNTVTAVDSSEGMLRVAARKVLAMDESSQERIACYVTCHGAKLEFDDSSFDTVVDTFGLCSFENPVDAVREMKRVCRPGGKILLLEHGRSHYEWLNKILDEHAYKHAKRWGCWWNRDIDSILEEAGLELEYSTRWHFGTTHYVIAKVPESMAEE